MYDSDRKDILLKGKRIFRIEDYIDEKKGWSVIDAAGKVVSPGFMSIHSHNDFYLPAKDHPKLLKSILYQGVTTSVGGNCGESNYPIIKSELKNIESYQGYVYHRKPNYRWGTLKEYLDAIEGKIIINYIPLVGHGTLRVIANGFQKDLSADSRNRMKVLLKECLDHRCFGLSSGLMYMPGTFSTTEELIELVKVVNEYPNTIYSSHLRGYSDTYIESVKEAIEIGRITGVRVQCSHLGPFGVKFGPQIDQVIELMNEARNQGVKIGYDSLAYCGGSTTIMALFPPWSYKDGLERFLMDIQDDAFYRKVTDYIECYVPRWPSWEGMGWTDNFVRSLGWENLYVLSAHNKEFVGKNFLQIGVERGTDKHEALRQVLIEEKCNVIMYMAGVGSCIDDSGDMSYFDRMIESPLSTIAVDAIFSDGGRTMPFAYGTFQRVIARYVRMKKTLTLKEVVEKFTSNVAEIFNITNRGYLKEGVYADIVVFDVDKMKDYPNIFSEKPELSSGVEYLLINGELIIDNRTFKERLSGEIIRNI
jgi:N-acyl-D-amino-acid deacylase